MKKFHFNLPNGEGKDYAQVLISLDKEEITDKDLYMVYYAFWTQLDNVILKKLNPDHMSKLDILELIREIKY